jgi:hypothetical protein
VGGELDGRRKVEEACGRKRQGEARGRGEVEGEWRRAEGGAC